MGANVSSLINPDYTKLTGDKDTEIRKIFDSHNSPTSAPTNTTTSATTPTTATIHTTATIPATPNTNNCPPCDCSKATKSKSSSFWDVVRRPKGKGKDKDKGKGKK
jgi:hypothetical protein